MARDDDRSPAPSDIAERMRTLRRAYTQAQNGHGAMTEFAEAMGFTLPRWHAAENGETVSFATADTLVKRIPGLSLDWIFYGKIGGLNVDVAQRLDVLPKPESDETPTSDSDTAVTG